jgi:hypothetical protein
LFDDKDMRSEELPVTEFRTTPPSPEQLRRAAMELFAKMHSAARREPDDFIGGVSQLL